MRKRVKGKKTQLGIEAMMYMLTSAYLMLTFYLFLSGASINILLLYAIFSYILYVPLVGIFSKPEKFKDFVEDNPIESRDQLKYITIFMLFSAFLLLFTNILSPSSLLAIAQSFKDGIPDFDFTHFLSRFFSGWSLFGYILFAFILLVAWQVFLMILAVVAIFWIIMFIFNFIINLLGFALFIALVLIFFVSLSMITYGGYQNALQYVEGKVNLALYIVSTITMGLYVFILIFANLVIN